MERHVVTQDGARYRSQVRAPWSPAQLVAGVVGLILVVIGGVALARGGVNFSDIPATISTVAGMHYTCLSALVQLVAGVILIGCCVHPDTAKSAMVVYGVVMLAFGLIIAIDPSGFVGDWNANEGNGVLYIILGVILLLAAALSPIFFSRSRTVEEHTGTVADAVPPAMAPTTVRPVAARPVQATDQWGRPLA